MLNSNLAIKLQSLTPLAIEHTAREKFLAAVHEINSDSSIRKVVQKVAYSPKVEKKFAIIDTNADDDDHMSALKMFGNMRTPYVTKKGTGVICVQGVIGKGLTVMEKMIGCTDVEDIQCQLHCWKKDDKVKRVVFKFNSGGGTTTGLEETAKMIFEYEKDTYSFADDDMGSAAYWIGSQAKRVIVTPSASLGSIGIYVAVVDESAKFEDDGKQVILIKAGLYKGAGVDGVPLTQLQGDYIQGEVDELHRRFKRDVNRGRPFVKDEDMQGQSFYGDIAAQKGLATGVVNSWREFLEDIEGPSDEIEELINENYDIRVSSPTMPRVRGV